MLCNRVIQVTDHGTAQHGWESSAWDNVARCGMSQVSSCTGMLGNGASENNPSHTRSGKIMKMKSK